MTPFSAPRAWFLRSVALQRRSTTPGRPTPAQKATRPRIRGSFVRLAALGQAAALTAVLAGCVTVGGVIAGSGGGATVTPVRGGSALEFNARSAVYATADANTIDLYLTDLSRAQLDALLGQAEHTAEPDTHGGQIVHIHLFLWPEAGRSPIDFDASNATLTHAVLTDLRPAPANAPGALEPRTVAIYSGGGFVLPRGLFAEAGDDWLSGRIRNGTVRYRAGTDASTDPLGVSSYRASFRARLDPSAAAEMEALLSAIDALAQDRTTSTSDQ